MAKPATSKLAAGLEAGPSIQRAAQAQNPERRTSGSKIMNARRMIISANSIFSIFHGKADYVKT
jgi:hypothetical protein